MSVSDVQERYLCEECSEYFDDAAAAVLCCIKKIHLCPDCDSSYDTKREANTCCPREMQSGYQCPSCQEVHESKRDLRTCCDFTEEVERLWECQDCGDEIFDEKEAGSHHCEEAGQ